jgi:aminopeptidase N
MSQELDYLPWNVAINNRMIYFIDMLISTEYYGELKSYLASLVKPYYDKLGWTEDRVNDLWTDRTIRNSLVTFACRIEEPGCVQTAKDYFSGWMSNPNINNIPKPLRAITYCTAIRNGGLEEFEFLFEQLQLNKDEEKTNLLTGLACANEEWQLQKFLNDRFFNRDAILTSLRYVIGRSPSYLTAWDFIKNNWNELYTR